MKRAWLKTLDIAEGTIELIMAQNGRDIERFKAEAALQKNRADSLAALLTDIAERLAKVPISLPTQTIHHLELEDEK